VKRARRGIVAAAVLIAVATALLFWPEAPPAPSGAWLARAGVTPRLARAGGLEVRYVRRGRGPVLILLHGFASSIYSWSEVLPALARSHDVVALDLPGFGGSEVPAELTGSRLVGVVPALMDQLAIPRATLVGNSLGGAVAALVAARHPERVEGLVLIDAAGFNLALADRPWILRLVGSAPSAVLERLPFRRSLVTLGLKQVFSEDALVNREKVEEYLAPLARPGTVSALRSLLASGQEMGLPEALRDVRAPTLVIWGRQDAWIPVADADRFVASIPGARKVIIEACGHLPQEEKPAEAARLIAAFARP
jgi:pimeloyl-ACP methyl ester carboxylesterase